MNTKTNTQATAATTATKVEVKFTKYENVLVSFLNAEDNQLTPAQVESASKSDRPASKVISSLKKKFKAEVKSVKNKNKVVQYVLTNPEELKKVAAKFEVKRTESAQKKAEVQNRKSTARTKKYTFEPLPVEDKPLVNPYKSDNFIHLTAKITPNRALQILSWYNNHNRPLTRNRVEAYIQAMKDGKWIAENGDTIRFSDDGILQDGQHRLMAIFESKTTQNCLLVRGISKDAFATMDYGKSRNGADVLYIAHKDGEEDHRVLVGLTKVLNSSLQWVEAYANLQEKEKRPETLTRVTTKNYDILDVLKNHRPLVESAKFIKTLEINKKGSVKLGLNEGQIAFIHYETSKINPKLSSEFLTQVFRGIGVEENSPAEVLRQFLIKNKQAKKSYVGGELLRRVIGAWNKLINDAECTPKTLQRNEQKFFPAFSNGEVEDETTETTES